jgi:hypothetical protein
MVPLNLGVERSLSIPKRKKKKEASLRSVTRGLQLDVLM